MSAAVSTTTTETTAIAQLSTAIVGLEPSSATILRSTFEEMFAKADEWTARAREIVVTREDQKREMKLARESRLALREIRVNAEKARKRLKEDSIRQGKAIDGIANVLKALIEPIEAHLLEQESFADRAAEARRDALAAARAEALRAYGVDPSVFASLGEMTEESWNATLDGARVAHEAKAEAARKEAEIRREAERIAAEKREEERQAQVRAEAARVERERLQTEENARLRREAEEREAAAKAERDRLEAEKAQIESEARAAKEAAEAAARAAREEADRAAAALEAERQTARDREAAEVARVAAEKAAAEQADRDRKAAEDAAREAAELAPDREKLAALAATLRAIKLPTLTTKRGQAAGAKVADQLAKTIAWIERTGASI